MFSMIGPYRYKCVTDLVNTTGLTLHADTNWLFCISLDINKAENASNERMKSALGLQYRMNSFGGKSPFELHEY